MRRVLGIQAASIRPRPIGLCRALWQPGQSSVPSSCVAGDDRRSRCGRDRAVGAEPRPFAVELRRLFVAVALPQGHALIVVVEPAGAGALR